MKKKSREQGTESRAGGFTIIELMISTAVFSVVLLLCATAIVQVGRMFYKGLTINRTQEASRKVVDDVIQSIQFGAKSANFDIRSGTAPGVQVICLGDVRYTFITSKSLGTGGGQYRHILWKDRLSSGAPCAGDATNPLPDLTAATPPGGGEELLGDNMRLPVFSVDVPVGSSNVWTVKATVAYGADDDVFAKNADSSPNYSKCIGSDAGGQFCAVSAIISNAAKRL